MKLNELKKVAKVSTGGQQPDPCFCRDASARTSCGEAGWEPDPKNVGWIQKQIEGGIMLYKPMEGRSKYVPDGRLGWSEADVIL